MNNQSVNKIVIAGGGSAGWMAAAALSKKLSSTVQIELVESDEIGTVGVGEATIPPIRAFHKLLGIDEKAFVAATNASFKLGISFENWQDIEKNYFHSFGQTGQQTWIADFIHFWLRAQKLGIAADFGTYCIEHQAAQAHKFALTQKPELNYAYHLDAGLYAQFLRKFSENNGAKRTQGKIKQVNQNNETGYIESLELDNGHIVSGDLFIDCTGFRGLLIEQTLHTGYQDWSHWLPCDSAIAVQTEKTSDALPYTRSIARDFGWQWQIPLQNRIGNGLVYCSKYLNDEAASQTLLNNLESATINTPRVIKYKTGRRLKNWNKNCVALGLASGFVEPLESTSLHLIMMGITRLIQLFSFENINQSIIDEYNQQALDEIEKIRDFIILHYHVTDRTDTAFWRYCKSMEVPPSLTHRINMFRENALAFQHNNELFRVDSWTQVMLGQGIMPKQYHKVVNSMPEAELKHLFKGMQMNIEKAVSSLPSHQSFLNQHFA
ncbi:tryptophan 7-halogenase [Catenovulum sp. 2E275]|uniref:tryptophan halogenase family protein n=1 Tax=Catenovulum sp. 2E275 TaxID=2980497 RepID=UPI0021D3D15B|nr:tryptophan halogenase family protein [Catenovulum sp. 2E275]MCU4677110.1 tryptophan 7-halogenase [Catenovulum sp. 2E275]